MGRILYKVVDTVVLILCLPFYAVFISLRIPYELIVPRVRKVRLGAERQRWQKRDVLEELRVVDVSRLADGRVGVQRRVWNVLYGTTPPPFPEKIEYCTVCEFWFGSVGLLQVLRRGHNPPP